MREQSLSHFGVDRPKEAGHFPRDRDNGDVRHLSQLAALVRALSGMLFWFS